MKRTTERIVEKLPSLAEKIESYGSVVEEDWESLSPVEQVFLKMAYFFENPREADFDLSLLYKCLDNDWLEWALELVNQFFREDTFLIQKPSFVVIKDGSEYLSLTQFAHFLTDHGLKYDRQKVNLYYERGKIPEPDLRIAGTKYWSKATAANYLEQEKNRL